jgi:nicotinate-nucleotide adenylyltransferase
VTAGRLPCGYISVNGVAKQIWRSPAALMPRQSGRLRIGLLGGSFNPPHAGHRLISQTALERLGLDAVWWLVTPGNPLKDVSTLPSLAMRMSACTRIKADPRIMPVAVEAALGTLFTSDTLAALSSRWPQIHFVWLMGADNLAQFHKWRDWQNIARTMPIAVLDRPGATHRALRAPAAIALNRYRLPEASAKALVTARSPAWMFLHGERSSLSSTLLRTRKATLFRASKDSIESPD